MGRTTSAPVTTATVEPKHWLEYREKTYGINQQDFDEIEAEVIKNTGSPISPIVRPFLEYAAKRGRYPVYEVHEVWEGGGSRLCHAIPRKEGQLP